MKKTTVLLATLFAVGIAGGLYFGVSKSEASATPEQAAKQAVTQYLEALKTGNVDEIMKYTNDTRFKDVESQRKVYTNLAKNERVKKTEIVSFDKVDDAHMKVSIRATTEKNDVEEQSVPVELINGSWKIVVGQN